MMYKSKLSGGGRRKFIKGLSSIIPFLFSDVTRVPRFHRRPGFDLSKLGLNLGTVQDQLVNDPMQTINTIHEVGLRYLELPDINLLNKLHPILTGAGFSLPSSFFPSPYITGNWAPMASLGIKLPRSRDFRTVVNLASQYELRYLVVPGIFPQDRGGLDVYRALAEKLNEAGQVCNESGIQLCYHHYSYEFQPMEESSPIQVMMQNLEHTLVKLQADTFWLSLTGIDVQDFLSEYHSFLGPMHLADKAADAPQTYRAITLPEGSCLPVGEGVVDFEKLLGADHLNDIPYYYIHLEDLAAPLNSVIKSVKYLSSLTG